MEFAGVSEVQGEKHMYLTMNLELGRDHYTLDMSGYLKKILEDRKTWGVNASASANLCKDPPTDCPLLDSKGLM